MIVNNILLSVAFYITFNCRVHWSICLQNQRYPITQIYIFFEVICWNCCCLVMVCRRAVCRTNKWPQFRHRNWPMVQQRRRSPKAQLKLNNVHWRISNIRDWYYDIYVYSYTPWGAEERFQLKRKPWPKQINTHWSGVLDLLTCCNVIHGVIGPQYFRFSLCFCFSSDISFVLLFFSEPRNFSITRWWRFNLLNFSNEIR